MGKLGVTARLETSGGSFFEGVRFKWFLGPKQAQKGHRQKNVYAGFQSLLVFV